MIPPLEHRDAPIDGGRIAVDVEDVGPPHLEIGWPMPPHTSPDYDALVSLSVVLGGRKGLLQGILGDRVSGWGAHVGHARDFYVFVMPGADQSVDDAERLVIDAITAVAEDRVDEAAWPDALSDASFEQLAWARGPGTLMLQIADSYLGGRPWSTGPGSPAAAPPTRAEIVAAAELLLSRGRVVVHKKSGKPPRAPTPSLPSRTLTDRPPRSMSSPLVRELLATPTTPTEPRFLVEGSHFETSTRGAGRVITVETDSPLFHLTWIYPVGTSEDPWACDALHARMRLVPITGAEVSVFCTTTDSRYEVTAAADRFGELMPPLLAWFDAGTASVADARDFANYVVDGRQEMREQAFLRGTAAEYFGLLGDAALDRQLPSDAEMRARGGTSVIAAFERMRVYDADVLYAGPDPDALRAALPPGNGTTLGRPYVRAYRQPKAPEILFIDDPNREKFAVRASLPWTATTPREHLAAALHRELVVDAEHTANYPPDGDAMGYSVGFSPGPPIAVGLGFDVAGEDVGVALDVAVAALRTRPSREIFDAARSRLEVAFRVHRTAPSRIPDLVYGWGPDATDPRVAQWLALPSLGYDDVMAYYDRIAGLVPVLVVCGPAEALDMAALRRFGKIIRVDPAAVMNDQMISGFGHDMPLLIDE